MISLEGKTAIITGASRGIGRGIALELAKEKMNLVLNYVSDSSKEKVQELQNEVSSLGSKSIIIQGDISKENDCKKILEESLKEFNFVDVLANNAGVYSSKPGTPTWDLDEKEFNRIFDTNVKGLFFMTKLVGKWMIDNNVKGSIINTASVAGLDASISGSIYGASKSAVIGFTKTWSKEFGEKGIRVNAVAPGPILTDLLKDMPADRKEQLKKETPLGKLAEPSDIGETVVFLAKNEAINGQTIVVDGGRVRH